MRKIDKFARLYNQKPLKQSRYNKTVESVDVPEFKSKVQLNL